MRLFVGIMALALVAPAWSHAQSASEPSLAFTISGGLTTGGILWNLDNQAILAPGGPPAQFDTMRLGRRMVPGITASLAVSYFRSPHWGLNAEVGYFGVGSEQQCTGPAVYKPDSENLNRQGCDRANGRHTSTSVIGFLVGGTYRFFPTAAVQPYLRGNVGLGLLGNSFVETLGIVQHSSCLPIASDGICPYVLLSERNKPGATLLVSLAGGFAYQLGPGYRVRMEFRDMVMTLPEVTGPAPNPGSLNNDNFPPTRNVVRHIPLLTIGFDVLLEQRRTRRY